MNITEHVKKLEEDKARANKELEEIKTLLEIYPDLQVYTTRSKRNLYYSSLVNTQATNYEKSYSCGCCPDSEVRVSPYLETSLGRVYSDPPTFTIGELSYFDRPFSGWDERLRAKSIPEPIIDRLTAFFAAEKEQYLLRFNED